MATKPPAPAKPPFTSTQATAVQALSNGVANDGQQKIVLRWLLDEVCQMGVLAYRETDRDTVMALGRQFVGARVVAAMNASVAKLKSVEEKRA
jgi:hypothetical protein